MEQTETHFWNCQIHDCLHSLQSSLLKPLHETVGWVLPLILQSTVNFEQVLPVVSEQLLSVSFNATQVNMKLQQGS